MQTVDIDYIQISPDRQRQEFDPKALQELTNSIQDRGLLHAPVCRQEGDSIILVAGERRLRAIKDIFTLGGTLHYNGNIFTDGIVPFVTLGELSPLEAEEAELDENLHRRDLSWQEHASAVQRLHLLRGKQASLRGEVQTVSQTALEVLGRGDGGYQDQVRKEIIVAQHLSDPDVAKAGTAKEAFKILKRKDELRVFAEKAVEVGKTFSAAEHEVFNEDCLEWMKEFVASGKAGFDVICTDPPYGMGADSFGDGAGKRTGIEHHYDDSLEAWKTLMERWCKLAYAVCSLEAHAYVWCDFDRFHELKAFMQAAGWYVFRTPLIVNKTGNGRVPLPEHGPRRQYEICLYAIKGNKRTTHIYPDVITCGADPNEGHGATKPVALFQNLLQRSVSPGDRILDTFAGSGPIFPAAHNLQCLATGVEVSEEYYGMCLKRLEKLGGEGNG